MEIKIDDFTGSRIQLFLREHLEDVHHNSPKESWHALSLEELRKPDITFWSAWKSDDELLGCVALRELDPQNCEIKSMRTVEGHRREGAATSLLNHILGEAKRRNYKRVSPET